MCLTRSIENYMEYEVIIFGEVLTPTRSVPFCYNNNNSVNCRVNSCDYIPL
jgi:hypothetical protein